MRFYRIFSLSFAIIFLIVGCLFLLVPGKILIFFNSLAEDLRLNQSPVPDFNFYVVLAVAYMYLATLVAFLMYKHPENSYFPLLLANGKLASSLISLCIFVFSLPYLILVVNCVVDGLIGIAAYAFYRIIKTRGS